MTASLPGLGDIPNDVVGLARVLAGVVCLFAPLSAVFFRGLSLALRSHDQIPASHWSTLRMEELVLLHKELLLLHEELVLLHALSPSYYTRGAHLITRVEP